MLPFLKSIRFGIAFALHTVWFRIALVWILMFATYNSSGYCLLTAELALLKSFSDAPQIVSALWAAFLGGTILLTWFFFLRTIIELMGRFMFLAAFVVITAGFVALLLTFHLDISHVTAGQIDIALSISAGIIYPHLRRGVIGVGSIYTSEAASKDSGHSISHHAATDNHHG